MARYKWTFTRSMRERVESDIRDYDENKRQLAEFKASLIPSTIPKYGPQTGGFDSEQRPTEDVAIRIYDDPFIQFMTWKVDRIGRVLNKLDETDKEIVDLAYNSSNLTVEGIAVKLHLGRTTVYQRLNNILVRVAISLGYIRL